jgi:hypothetical protein
MRGLVLAAAAVLSLPGGAAAQKQVKQVEFRLVWDLRHLPGEIKDYLNPSDVDKWKGQQTELFLKHLKGLRFWKFTAAEQAQGTLCINVRTDGKFSPGLEASIDVQLPGGSSWEHIWSRTLYTNVELNCLVYSGYKAPVQLAKIADRLNNVLLDNDFKGNVKPLFAVAWVADGVVEVGEECRVALPLPWEDVKESAQSAFRIECDGPDGDPVARKATGLARFYPDKDRGNLLLAKLEQSLKGLNPKRVFVTRDVSLPSNPALDIAGRCP